MNYYLRYHRSDGKNLYLTKDNQLARRKNSHIRKFQSALSIKQCWASMDRKKKRTLLRDCNISNFDIIANENQFIEKLENNKDMTTNNIQNNDIENELETDFADDSADIADDSIIFPAPKTYTKKPDIPTLQETFDYLKENGQHCLILDLEFYLNSKQETKIKQIGGIVLSTGKQFNKFIFDSNDMSTQQQLNFLKEHNLTYAEANKLTPSAIMQEVQRFIRDNMIDTIVSWDNHLDFKALKAEGFDKIVPSNMKTYDLEKIFANTNNNNDLSLNLQNFTTILNVPHTGKWHDALDDSRAIYQLCQLYLKVLIPLNNNTKQTVPAKHF